MNRIGGHSIGIIESTAWSLLHMNVNLRFPFKEYNDFISFMKR